MEALNKQVGGGHYKGFKIQPVEFCYVNNIPYLEATAIKYLCRWRDKGGIQDLEKAKHFIELLIELEGKHNVDTPKDVDKSLQDLRNFNSYTGSFPGGVQVGRYPPEGNSIQAVPDSSAGY